MGKRVSKDEMCIGAVQKLEVCPKKHPKSRKFYKAIYYEVFANTKAEGMFILRNMARIRYRPKCWRSMMMMLMLEPAAVLFLCSRYGNKNWQQRMKPFLNWAFHYNVILWFYMSTATHKLSLQKPTNGYLWVSKDGRTCFLSLIMSHTKIF